MVIFSRIFLQILKKTFSATMPKDSKVITMYNCTHTTFYLCIFLSIRSSEAEKGRRMHLFLHFEIAIVAVKKCCSCVYYSLSLLFTVFSFLLRVCMHFLDVCLIFKRIRFFFLPHMLTI